MAYAKEAGLDVTDVKITSTNTDGTSTDYDVDMSKVIFGDIEGNGKIRIEIYNEYGDTKNDSPINQNSITFDDKLEVTFTITGIDAAADAAEAEETEASAEETEAPVEETEAPVEETEAPVEETEAVVEETEAAPAETTAAVVEETPVETAAPAAGDVSAETTSTKASPNTGIADVAAVAGIAVVAAGAFVVAKKRK